ncbi:MAG: DNA polymerase III subunit delta [Elusimicrobiota bacterium]|nr:DNA polymerase III subunit delta [Elusimicrobiota bacterium]
MPQIKPEAFVKQIKSTKMPPVVLIAGDELYFSDMCLKAIKESFCDNFNRDVFYVNDTGFSIDMVFSAIQTVSFLSSSNRVVIVKNVEAMTNKDAQRVEQYISNPIDDAHLILVYYESYREIKKENKNMKEMLEECEKSNKAIAVNCSKVYDRDAGNFIRAIVMEEGKNITADAVSSIISDNGCDLLNISNEIEKLVLFVGKDGENITQDDIEYISGWTKEINPFALSEHIEAKNAKKALFVLEKLLYDGDTQTPIRVLSTISNSIRRMLCAKSLYEEKGELPEQVLPFNMPSFKKTIFTNNLHKFSLNSLRAAMKEILNTDISIKTTSADSFSSFERLILAICVN